MSVLDIVHRPKLVKVSFLVVAMLLVSALFVGKAYGGGPGACDDDVPDAFFTIQPTSKAVNELNATLNGNSSVACNDPIVSYEWNFGDGSTGSGAYVSHSYAVGTYYPTLTITDAAGLTDTHTPQTGVIIKADNQDPVLTDAAVSVLQGEAITVDVSANGSDPDGDDVSHAYYLPQLSEGQSSLYTGKGNVHLSSDSGQFVYTADTSTSGQDSFQVGIRDGFGGTAIATVTITINTHVTAVADAATTQENHDVVIPVTANDYSYQDQPFEIYTSFYMVDGGDVISVDKAAGTITFRPDPGFVGTAEFQYGIKSLVPNTWRISLAPVTVTVTPDPNHAPSAINDTLGLDEDTTATINVLANDVDQDGDVLSPSIVTGPQHGTATLAANGTLQYTPTGNYFGSDTVTYRVADAGGKTSTAVVTIFVHSVNDAPHAAFTWGVQSGGSISFNAGGSNDIDDAIVSYQWNFGDGESQTVSAPTTTHKYKGKGSKTVTLKVTDATGAQTVQTRTITL